MGKSVTLLTLVFVLVSLIAGGMSIQRAVMNTEENLRRSMPPIVAIEFDREEWMTNFNQLRDYEHWNLTADFVREVGALPYVSHFNYTIGSFLSSFDFETYDPGITGDTGDGSWRVDGAPNFMSVTGVSSADIIYIAYREDVELVAGRMFEEHEMTGTEEVIPIVISEPLAAHNGLSVGSTFTLYDMIVNDFEFSWVEGWQEELLAQAPYTFIIVGLFDLIDRQTDLSVDIDADWNEWNRQVGRLNTAFIPARAAETINREHFDRFMGILDEHGFDAWWIEDDAEHETHVTAIFILNDSLEIAYFRAAVLPLIPDYYRVADLSGGFEDMQSSMETMLWIGDVIFIAATLMTVLILSLIITLFLRDRRYEMGIYLALGEKKARIVTQVMLEVVVVALFGITLAIFAGNVVSTQMSQSMLRHNLTSQVTEAPRNMSFGGDVSLDELGFMIEMSPDDMMQHFDIDMNAASIGLLYGISTLTVVVSTLIPMVYLIRLNPKKILMEAKN